MQSSQLVFMATLSSAFIAQFLAVASLVINVGYSFKPCFLVSYGILTHRHFYSYVRQINLNIYVTNVHTIDNLQPGPCNSRHVSLESQKPLTQQRLPDGESRLIYPKCTFHPSEERIIPATELSVGLITGQNWIKKAYVYFM